MYCLDCKGEDVMCLDEEDDPSLNKNWMCNECGHEFTDADWKFRGYKVGNVLDVTEMKAPLKKCVVQIEPDSEEGLQIVTNAKHIAEGDRVVVATIDAIVPAGAQTEDEGGQGIILKKATVGNEKSEGILCDGVMLGWQGGSNGVLVKLDAEKHEVGSVPPANKPNNK